MINRQHVTPVGTSETPPMLPDPPLTPDALQKWLHERGHMVSLGRSLKGGAVSDVYEATDEMGTPIIVKYTFDTADRDPTVLFLTADEHFLDTQLLRYLSDAEGVRVPRVLHAFEDFPVTIMEDMRSSGFVLMSDQLLDGLLPHSAAGDIGRSIANILLKFAEHAEFKTHESAFQIYYEYGQELRHAYPDQVWYDTLETRITTANQQLLCVDTHPKNLFTNTNGQAAWIDFGRSVWGGRDFALPNFLADTVVYALSGDVPRVDMAEFIADIVSAYRSVLPIRDDVLCTYMAGEIVQRWNGRWIEGINTTAKKLSILSFGMKIFDDEVFKLDDLFDELVSTGTS